MRSGLVFSRVPTINVYIHEGCQPWRKYTFIVLHSSLPPPYTPPYTFHLTHSSLPPPIKGLLSKSTLQGVSRIWGRSTHLLPPIHEEVSFPKRPCCMWGGSSHRWHPIRKKPLRVHRVATMRRLPHMHPIRKKPVLESSHCCHCNSLQHTATHCNTLQHTATHCNTLNTLWGSLLIAGTLYKKRPILWPRILKLCCSVLQCVAVCCSVLQCQKRPLVLNSLERKHHRWKYAPQYWQTCVRVRARACVCVCARESGCVNLCVCMFWCVCSACACVW